jgi:hypothetical protein
MADENMYQQNTLENPKVSKFKKLWNKFDLFCKFIAIIGLFALLFLLIAITSTRPYASQTTRNK